MDISIISSIKQIVTRLAIQMANRIEEYSSSRRNNNTNANRKINCYTFHVP